MDLRKKESTPREKAGPWTKSEDELIKVTIEAKMNTDGLEPSDLFEKKAGQNFYSDLVNSLPGRRYHSVYRRARKILWEMDENKTKPGTPWTDFETRRLLELYAIHGPQFGIIGKLIGRSGPSCRDKYRLETHRLETGRWTKEELQKLFELVNEYLQKEGRTSDDPGEIPWTAISKKHGTRDRKQCQRKWARHNINPLPKGLVFAKYQENNKKKESEKQSLSELLEEIASEYKTNVKYVRDALTKKLGKIKRENATLEEMKARGMEEGRRKLLQRKENREKRERKQFGDSLIDPDTRLIEYEKRFQRNKSGVSESDAVENEENVLTLTVLSDPPPAPPGPFSSLEDLPLDNPHAPEVNMDLGLDEEEKRKRKEKKKRKKEEKKRKKKEKKRRREKEGERIVKEEGKKKRRKIKET